MSSPEDHENHHDEEGDYYNPPDPVLRVARRLYGRLINDGEVVREEGFAARTSLLKHLNQLGVKISKEELDAAIASQNIEEEEPGGRVDIEEFQQRCVPLLCELDKNVSEPDSPSPHPASPLVQTPAQIDANPELRTLAQLMTAVGIEGAHENSPEVAAVARALRDLTSPKNRSPFRPLPPRLAQVLNGHGDSEHVIEDHVTDPHNDHVLESDSEHDVNALKDKLKRVKEENHVLTLKVNMLESRVSQQEQQHDDAVRLQRESSEEIERLKKVTKHKSELEHDKHVLIEQLEALKAELLSSTEAVKELKRKESEWSAEKDDMRNDVFTKMKELNDMQDELTQLRQHANKSQELTQHNQSQLKSLEQEQRQEIERLTQERDELALKLSVLGEEKREMEVHVEEMTRQLEHVKLDLKHLQEEKLMTSSTMSDSVSLQAELKMEEEKSSLRALLAERESEVNALKLQLTTLDTTAQQLHALQEQHSALQQSRAQNESARVNELSGEVARLSSALQDLETRSTAREAELNAQLTEREKSVQGLQEQLATLTADLTRAGEELTHVKASVAQLEHTRAELTSAQEQLQSLHDQLRALEDQASASSAQSERDLAQLRASVADKDKQLHEQSDMISASGHTIEELQRALEQTRAVQTGERDSVLHDLRESNSALQQKIADLTQHTSEQTRVIDELTASNKTLGEGHAAQAKQLDEVNAQLSETRAHLEQCQQDNSTLQRTVDELRQSASEQSRVVDELTHSSAAQLQTIAELTQHKTELHASLTELQQRQLTASQHSAETSSDQERALTELRARAEEQERTIDELRHTLGEQTTLVQDKDKIINGQNREISAKDEVISDRNTVIEEHERVISELRAGLEEQKKAMEDKDKVIHGQNREISAKDDVISELRAGMEEQRKSIEDKDKIINGQNREISAKDELISDRNTVIEEHERVISELRSRVQTTPTTPTTPALDSVPQGEDEHSALLEQLRQRAAQETQQLRHERDALDQQVHELQRQVQSESSAHSDTRRTVQQLSEEIKSLQQRSKSAALSEESEERAMLAQALKDERDRARELEAELKRLRDQRVHGRELDDIEPRRRQRDLTDEREALLQPIEDSSNTCAPCCAPNSGCSVM